MTTPTPESVKTLADGLTKASRRALMLIESDRTFTDEGSPGPARKDVYSLWWGKDGKHRLVDRPQPFAFGQFCCSYRWRLTQLGKLVKAHIGASHD